jgi:hypothetical protein
VKDAEKHGRAAQKGEELAVVGEQHQPGELIEKMRVHRLHETPA